MQMPGSTQFDFAASADKRVATILALWASGEARLLNRRTLAMSLPAVCKHLKVLNAAGLIAKGREDHSGVHAD